MDGSGLIDVSVDVDVNVNVNVNVTSTSMKTGKIPNDVSTPSYTFWQNLTYVKDGVNTEYCKYTSINVLTKLNFCSE